MKANRAYLENKIFQMIQRDSRNTPHFNYKVNFEEGTITLEVYTYNPLQKALHFLHSVTSERPDMCLVDMVVHLEQMDNIKKESNPYTVFWKKVGEDEFNKSYYFEQSPEDALVKFFVGKNPKDYITEVRQNPQS